MRVPPLWRTRPRPSLVNRLRCLTLEDGLLNLTNLGDIVIDPFLGLVRPSSPPR